MESNQIKGNQTISFTLSSSSLSSPHLFPFMVCVSSGSNAGYIILSAHIVLNNRLSKHCAACIPLAFITEVHRRLKSCVRKNLLFDPQSGSVRTPRSTLSVTDVSSLVCCSVLPVVLLLTHLVPSERTAPPPSALPSASFYLDKRWHKRRLNNLRLCSRPTALWSLPLRLKGSFFICGLL